MSSDDNDANVIPIYDQNIFNFCGRIRIAVFTFILLENPVMLEMALLLITILIFKIKNIIGWHQILY